MKKYLLLLALAPLSLFAQDKKWEIGIGVGNNGQLDKTLNDFYYLGHETGHLDDSKIDKTTHLKFNFYAGYRVNENWGARVKFGYTMRNEDYVDYWPTSHAHYLIDQNVVNVSPGVFFTKDLDRFQFSTGLEIPLHFVSDMNMRLEYREMQDSVNTSYETVGEHNMTGGVLLGLNNFVSFKYAFTDWMAIGGEINYGLMYANIGETVSMTYNTSIPAPQQSSSIENKNYKKTFFSAPEVAMGLYFRF